MQLIAINAKKTRPSKSNTLSKKVGIAAAALLGMQSATTLADEPWKVEVAGLVYSESDDRVSAFEPVIQGVKEYGDNRRWDLKLVLDSLTGASPTGALPSDTIQTFTRPSGNGSYDVPAGELPKDDTFKDTRVAFSTNWQQPLSDSILGTLGANLSKEYDFASFGISGSLAFDFNQKNTTLNLGLGIESDQIDPEGGIPDPFSAMQPTSGIQPRVDSSDSKILTDLLIGITQVINRRMLMQFNYSLSQSDGYLTDPFKFLSVVNDTTGETVGADAYLFEHRPDSRTKHALFWRTKYRLDRDMIDISYRYLWDDWDISSHTIDFRYRWNFVANQYLEPHLRWYQQSEAEFYRPLLLESDVLNGTLPTYASADLRLAEFDATTLGFKYGYRTSNQSEWSVRAEFYQQSGNDKPDQLFGANANQSIFTDLDALILQVGYSFEW